MFQEDLYQNYKLHLKYNTKRKFYQRDVVYDETG